MGTSVVTHGKTVDDAVQIALKQLKVARSQVSIEILQKPNNHMFKLRSVQAEVRVTVNERKSPPTQAQIWVDNGKLKYIPSQAGGNPLSLYFGPQFTVTYQEQTVTGHVSLEHGIETLEIQFPEDKEPYKEVTVIVAQDKLSAHLCINRQDGVRFSLADCSPTSSLHLSLQEKIIPAPAVTQADIDTALSKAKIRYGINLNQATPETLSKKSVEIEIASGDPPAPPVDSVIEYIFKNQKPSPDPDSDAERIDYYETQSFVSVEKGDVLAKKLPGRKGQDGRDVYGSTISAANPRDIDLAAGEGAQVDEDGLTIYATQAGLPIIKNQVLSVCKVYELTRDADIETGHIRFKGDIIIRGNVCEQVRVEAASGSIQVFGMTSGATILADRDISITHNAVSSQIIAGGIAVANLKILSHLLTLSDQIQQLLGAYYVVSAKQQTHAGKLIKNLLELKFHNIPREITKLTQYMSNTESLLDSEFNQFIRQLDCIFLSRDPLEMTEIQPMEDLLVEVQQWRDHYKKDTDQIANIIVSNLQNSKLEASGIISVSGKGSYYSTVIARKGFKQTRGLFRGGELLVEEGNISVKEIGGPTGIATKAIITQMGKMSFGTVHPNVTVEMRDQKYLFDHKAKAVRVIWTDQLKVYSGSTELM